MEWNFLSMCVLFLAALTYIRGIQSCKSTSTFGTHFMIGIPESYPRPNCISLHITSTNVTNVRIIAPSISYDTTFQCNMHLIVNMSSRIMLDSPEVVHKNGIKIMSEDACSVTVLSHHGNDAAEGFMALPVNGLSTQYIVSSYNPNANGKSEFLIVAPENFTKIEMMLKYGYHVTKRNITLNEFETYMYQSSNDISGSVIRSDKPVAVFSGSSSSNIPDGQGDYQYIVEQMIPEVFLAKTFIIPPIYPRSNYMFRVFPIVDRTTLLLHKDNNNQTDILRNTSIYEYTQSYPTVLIADQPISVMQYGYDTDNSYGDPFMTTVQAISQFQSLYEFISDFGVMGSYIWDATLVVTAENLDLPDIQLDSVSLLIHPHHKEYVRPPYANYSIIYVNITHGNNMNEFHHLRHTKGRPFGASLYSLPGIAAAYGYPLKFALKDEECQVLTTTTTTTSQPTTSSTTATTMTTTTTTTQPSTTTSTTKATTTTSPLPTTTAALDSTSAYTSTTASTPAPATITSSTTTSTHSNTTSSMQCFSCRDIPHLKYCDKVATCSENEVCYVESYIKPPGTVLFKTGCVNQEVCNIPTGPNQCLQCCDSASFCNVQGCGDNGVTGLHRGPYCYDCTHIGEAENCQSVQMCPSDQVCMIEKFVWGDDDFNYIMGCIHPHVCEVRKRSMDPDRKLSPRHIPECTHCCSSDFCNRNCTHHHIQEIVG